MFNHTHGRFSPASRFAAVACTTVLLASACGSGDDASEASATTAAAESTAAPETTSVETDAAETGADAGDDTVPAETATDDTATGDTVFTETESSEAPADTADTVAEDAAATEASGGCADIAAQFVTRGSANADLDDPEVNATCADDTIVVTSNGIPDYTYVETSPGQPTDRDHTFSFPASPTVAESVTAVPTLGTAAVSLGGIPIFGPTEGTGGDVESLPGILSDCGSHNGPSGFHIHLILTSSETDCLFTPDEVAAAPQLVGYAFDGFPIYTGIDQYTSSWQLTDESLFATDTWAAHSYVEGSGDLDECNGLTDADGNYAYYTTATFPYVLGCYTGVVDLDAAGGGGGGGGAGQGADGEERPEPPEGGAGGAVDGAPDRPERPAPPEGDTEGGAARPERPAGQDAPPEAGAGE